MPITRKLEQVIQLIENDFTNVRNDFLKGMAGELVRLTASLDNNGPAIDTGAYISSHSITTTKGSGRGRSSRNKTRGIAPGPAAALSLSAMYDDINSLPKDTTHVYMNNNSPHAQLVEMGWPTKSGYHIYSRTKREANNFLKEAVMNNRG